MTDSHSLWTGQVTAVCTATQPGQRAESPWDNHLRAMPRCVWQFENPNKTHRCSELSWPFRRHLSSAVLGCKINSGYRGLTALSPKLMEEGWGANRTFHQHTAWGKKLINELMFQPEQDKTNRNLQSNPPFSAPGIPRGDPGHCFF